MAALVWTCTARAPSRLSTAVAPGSTNLSSCITSRSASPTRVMTGGVVSAGATTSSYSGSYSTSTASAAMMGGGGGGAGGGGDRCT
eukprot:4620056-Pyramimonas_sp.AAC.1